MKQGATGFIVVMAVCLGGVPWLFSCTSGLISSSGEPGDGQDTGFQPDQAGSTDDGGMAGDDGLVPTDPGGGGDDGGSGADGVADAGVDGGGDPGGDGGNDAGDGAPAHVIQVGPTRLLQTPCQAAATAQDGDLVEIDAGEYVGDVCAWTQNNLTLRAVGGFAHLRAGGQLFGGKAIWVIQGSNTTVEWIEFSEASVPSMNGAGIRQEGPGLVLRHCFFHDNEDGILAGDNASSDILIEYTEFARNGYGDGQSHNLYINHVHRLIFQYNYSHDANQGHDRKSRALENQILYNRITDENGTPSYTVQLPNGGPSYLIGNLLEQGPNSPNHTMISYGDEGLTNPNPELYLVNNTLVNDYAGGTFVNIQAGATATLTNNLFVGQGTILNGTALETTDLTDVNGACLKGQTSYNYALVGGCPANNTGTDPGSASGFDLTPHSQYVHPCAREDRPQSGPLDIGAYEYNGG